MKKLLVVLASVWGRAGSPVAAADAVTVSGTVVDADTDRAVKRAIVVVYDYDSDQVRFDRTDRDGTFSVEFDQVGPFPPEEFTVLILGSRGYESGFVGCSLTVVSSIGESCTLSPDTLAGDDIVLERR